MAGAPQLSAETDGQTFSFAVVVPAHQASHQIGACLEGLFAAGFAPGDIVVVDDGSTDQTSTVARAAGITVLRNELPAGPAGARNRGVQQALADIIVFCDADVVLHPGMRERLLAHFRRDAELAAVFGSYDDSPPASRIVSRYRNLLHHFVHQHSRPDASTFWTGFGAVRRADFLRLGGFDAAWENIEDVEFGLRLKRSGGRILLDRGLLGTHLKEWTLGSMLRSDWKGRAVPWTRLLMCHDAPRDDLNLALPHRMSGASVAAFFLFSCIAVFEAWALVGVATAAAGFIIANRVFITYLAARGFRFMLCALVFHVLHYVAALLGYSEVVLTEAMRRFRMVCGCAGAFRTRGRREAGPAGERRSAQDLNPHGRLSRDGHRPVGDK